MPDEIRMMASQDDEILAEWVREGDDPDIQMVDVCQLARGGEWPWQVEVAAAEFVREEPFESEFRDRIDQAIRSVPGVQHVVEEDREVWLVSGNPDAEHLVRTVADAVDALAEGIRAAMEGG